VTKEDEDIVRVIPLGMLRYAIEYYDAAKVVTEKRGDCVPGRFLLGHAIELALKAFLLQQGKTESFIRGVGHGLTACLASAEANKPRDQFITAPGLAMPLCQSALLSLRPF